MSFRISARTILHLGSELISSDGVAFYELIKNSLDAWASRVTIDVQYRLDHRVYEDVLRRLGEDRDDPDWSVSLPGRGRVNWRSLRDQVLDGTIEDAPGAGAFRQDVQAAATRADFLAALRAANVITISDDGYGMSKGLLQDVYLTIGTSYRADQKRERRQSGQSGARRPDGSEDVILGEKGLGRLSAMRLGDRLDIVTGVEGRARWNSLSIDWNDFADANDADLDSVDVSVETGASKPRSQSGTIITISALRSEWSAEKLEQLAIEQFSRLIDPLDPDRSALPLEILFNNVEVRVPRFADFLLDHAHGRLRATFTATGATAPRLSGRMEYRLHRRSAAVNFSTLDLETLTEFDQETLQRIGPFELDMYWFNRRILTKIEGIGSLAVVRRILSEWAGGVALYRNGYRVNPYGGPKDDWLDLDRDAFSTSGFKLNRGQIVGRALITQDGNRYLIDQTNREGLKDNAEMRAFTKVLSAVVEHYRQYIVEIDKDVARAKRITAEDAINRFRAEDEKLGDLIPQLEGAVRGNPEGAALGKRIRETLAELRKAASDVQAAAGQQVEERNRVMHLASIGLMIEILAHELYRATSAGLTTIAQARRSPSEAQTSASLRVLDAQLRTLQKRLKVLDPLSTNARQTKEEFDLVDWVADIADGFGARNRSSRVTVSVVVMPRGSDRRIRAVKGMFVQVLENLLTNSIFWVAQRHRREVQAGLATPDDEPIGNIVIRVDTVAGAIMVTDDGPGIPEERRELVFQPFFSTRPQKQGRGLGLYIAREIAEYHGGSVHLGEADDHGQIHSVIFEIGNVDAG
ncbi:ATP-binding protein [Brevundimonas sp. FT23042]|uniref:ATP-binding protein n=1 Tax=Brevundimonas sp. FT23042 TaxID=3393749 RepID=UPI003B586DB8